MCSDAIPSLNDHSYRRGLLAAPKTTAKMKLPLLGTRDWGLATARISGVIGCGLAIAIALPWWVIVFFGGVTLWAFSTDPPPQRLFVCQREGAGGQFKVMTDREAAQRNAALTANGLEERWRNS